jgi:diguanylate cyclase (GGDEF)-like protein
MKIRTSFRGKLLLLTILPLAVAQIVTLLAVMRTVEEDVDRRARESLVIGGAVVNEFLTGRGEQLRASVEVLAADFGLKEATATGDAETIQSVLSNHSQRVGADVALLLDLDGAGVASSNGAPLGNRTEYLRLIENAREKSSAQSTAMFDGDTYHTFTVPVRAPVAIAWVVLGFRIDSQLTLRIRGLTGLEVSIVSTSTDNAGTISTTRHDNFMDEAEPTLAGPATPLNSIYMIDEAGLASLTLSTPFVHTDNDVLVVLQRSLQEAMAPYTEAREGLFIFAALLLVFVAAAGAWFSGTVASPLRVLTVAARRMISGNYDMKIRVRTNDEFGELASSFNAMRTAIADREKRISHQALHDPLTDLPNRAMVMQRLTGAIEHARSADANVAVVSIMLSRMNEISSTLGHSASDEVIALAAKHLRVNLDPGEILGHIGTNEFVLVLPDSDIDDAIDYADRIESILGAGVTLHRVNITLQTEIGISGFPIHGDIAADILRYASIARSEAHLRKERVMIYEAGREDHYVRQLRIVNDLRAAIQRNEIHLHFQPKISLPDGAICGVESLVRWDHGELGWLSPDDFIPAAEQSGTIVHLTRFVLAATVKQCREWHDSGHALRVSVNLSSRDLQDEYLPYYILQLLKEHDVPPNWLTLEITENSVMQDIHHAIAVLECLRDIGVDISMDDFGTGHSSLAQIKNMPLHEIKIDKSFVMNLMTDDQNRAIVQTTIELAHNMKLKVVAEGVEDEDTLRQLCDMGCEEAQGFFLSKPVPAAELIDWLENREKVSYAERRKSKRAFAKKA